jgi:hypothetical protein
LDLYEDCGHARSAKNRRALVRPDMHIAWRANRVADDPGAEPLELMSRILPQPI